MKIRYIPQENAKLIVNILKRAQGINKLVKFKVINDESGGVLYYGGNPEMAVHDMVYGANYKFRVNCVEDWGYDHDNKVLGWFFFTPYEELDCVLCDHNDNEFCNQCVKGVKDEEIYGCTRP